MKIKYLSFLLLSSLLVSCSSGSKDEGVYTGALSKYNDVITIEDPSDSYPSLDINQTSTSSETLHYQLDAINVQQAKTFTPSVSGTYKVTCNNSSSALKIFVGTGNIVTDSFKVAPFTIDLTKNKEVKVVVFALNENLLYTDIAVTLSIGIADRDISNCSSFTDHNVSGATVYYQFTPSLSGKHIIYLSREYAWCMELFDGTKSIDRSGWGNVSAVLTKGKTYTLKVDYNNDISSTVRGTIERPASVNTDFTEALNSKGYVHYRFKVTEKTAERNFQIMVPEDVTFYVSSTLFYVERCERKDATMFSLPYDDLTYFGQENDITRDSTIDFGENSGVATGTNQNIKMIVDKGNMPYDTVKNWSRVQAMISIKKTKDVSGRAFKVVQHTYGSEEKPDYAYISFFKAGFQMNFAELSETELKTYQDIYKNSPYK